MKIKIEVKEQKGGDPILIGNAVMMMTPAIDENYWKYRIEVSPNQAIVGFPKFGTIGIGFQHETDWNTNLPSNCDSKKILNHIWHNRGKGNDGKEFKKKCIEAIETIQQLIKKEKKS